MFDDMRTVTHIADRYVDQLAQLDPLTATSVGITGFDHLMTDLSPEGFAARAALARVTIAELEQAGRVVRGEFLPGGHEREWCDKNVLRLIKQRSLAKLRKAIEPAPPEAEEVVAAVLADDPVAADVVVEQVVVRPEPVTTVMPAAAPANGSDPIGHGAGA